MTTREDILRVIETDYLREQGYPGASSMTEEQFAVFFDNLKNVCYYILDKNLEEANVINSAYNPSVMVFVILATIAKDGYLDKITNAETFYNFCVTYTERECQFITSSGKKTRSKCGLFEKCCEAAAVKIEEVLRNGVE